jgi:N-acetylglucosamine transport system permease protein
MSAPLKETAPTGGTVPPQPSAGKSPARPGEPRGEGVVLNVFSHGFLALWALLIVLPLLWLVLSSFKTDVQIGNSAFGWPHNWTFDVFRRAWSKGIGDYFLNTLIVLVFSVPLTMLFGSMAAYVLARYQFWGNRLLYYFFVAGAMFPVFLALVPLFFMVKRLDMLNTYPGADPGLHRLLDAVHGVLHARVLPDAAHRGLRGGRPRRRLAHQDVLPSDVADGESRIDQRRHLQHPRSVEPVHPADGPDAAAERLGPGALCPHPGAGATRRQQGYKGDWSGLFAGLVMAMLPVLAAYIVFQRQVVQGLTAGALK